MKRNNNKLTATLVASVAILLTSAIMLLHLIGAGIWVQYEECCAAEIYRATSLSPNGPSETWDEMSENIKSNFSEGSWAERLVSGNTDKGTSFVLVSGLILALISSFIAIRVELQIKERKAREKRNEEAKRKYEIVMAKVDAKRKSDMMKFLSHPID